MSELNQVTSVQKTNSVAAADSAKDILDRDSDSQKKIAEELLKESTNYTNDSNIKADQARELLHAADALEKMAQAVRDKANQLRNQEISKEKAIEEIKKIIQINGQALEFPIPRDATPEQLEALASAIEKKAKENRVKADGLLKESEHSARIANQLKEQVELVKKKEMNFSDLNLKSAAAHNEGLNMIFKKLGIYRLDSEYKEQVASSEKKAQEAAQM